MGEREIRLATDEWEYALHLAKTGDRRSGMKMELLWSRIRQVLSQAAGHLEEHARERFPADEHGYLKEETN